MSLVLSLEHLVDDRLREARSNRYATQSVAKVALPKERVSKCLRQVINGQVEVWKHRKTSKSFYGGLMVCGSVWVCPVCAGKISERRRNELKMAYDSHIESGGHVALLTLTFSHQRFDILKNTLEKFSKASAKFRSGYRYHNLRKKMGLIGSIRAFEVTYGSNGFHPHTHTALFYTNDVDLKLIEAEFFELWEKACSKFGLTTKEQYGLSLENGEQANDYMSKHGTWGLDRELTKSHIKKGKKESLTPFDFLRMVLETGDSSYIDLFREYAEAFKGKTQLYWSRGLKSRFVIEDKSDEDLAKESQEEADLLGLLDYQTWKLILKHDKRSYVLDLCEKYGFESAIAFIKTLQQETNKTLFDKKRDLERFQGQTTV